MQNRASILHAANPAADRQRNENLASRACHHVDHDLARVAGRGDVQKHQLVGALLVVARGEFHRIARVAQPDEIHSLHHASAGDVETRNDALHEHTKFRTICNPAAPDFSGWNCTALMFPRSITAANSTPYLQVADALASAGA